MKIRNEFLIIFLFIWLLLHSCNPAAHAHDTHVSDFEVKGTAVWVAGNTFRDTDRVCWQVYRDPEPMTITEIKLHIKEVPCP